MMKGRDLILYILLNNLEDEDIVDENGVIIGFMSVEDAAVKYEVGVATVHAWIDQGLLKSIKVGERSLILMDEKRPNP